MFSKPQITPKKIWGYEGKNSCSKNVLKTPKQPKFGVKKTQMATLVPVGKTDPPLPVPYTVLNY